MGVGLLGKETMAGSCVDTRTLERDSKRMEMDSRALEIKISDLP